jgi:hypothetical protein
MTMKMMKSQNSQSSSASSSSTAATTPAAPATPATPTAAPADLVSATVAPAPGLGQLASLDRFESKDPFSQQIALGRGGAASGATAGAAGQTPRAGGSAGGASPSTGAPVPSRPSGTAAPAAGPPPTSAVISVNGGPAQQITLDQDFPLPPFDPIFHLVSLTRNAAKVSIVGGSYADGVRTVTVRKGRPLTLMNTADGTRYVLRLLWVGAGAAPKGLLPPPPQPNSPTATTPSPSTPPTAPTATTP